MATLSVADLLGLFRELPLLEPAQAQELPRLAAEGADVVRLLKELQRRQWLTTYQLKSILTGEGKGLVVGPYLLVELLGQGAMGRVFLARHTQTKKQVALKVIPPETLQHKRAALRFQREVYAAAQLTHPNVVLAYDAGQSGQTCYMAMEYVEGIDLSRLVKQNGPMPPPLACDLVRQAALGLQHAHDKDLIHRDIKPSNLMVVRNPDHPPLIKMLDFGLARLLTESDGESRLTQVGGVVGTVDYIAPEQAVNARHADARSDIFSLGATLFYILTGMPPYAGKDMVEKVSARVLGDAAPLSTYRGNLPTGLEEVVAKMLARDPALRYCTAAGVAVALEPFCLGAAVKETSAPPPSPEKNPSPQPKNPSPQPPPRSGEGGPDIPHPPTPGIPHPPTPSPKGGEGGPEPRSAAPVAILVSAVPPGAPAAPVATIVPIAIPVALAASPDVAPARVLVAQKTNKAQPLPAVAAPPVIAPKKGWDKPSAQGSSKRRRRSKPASKIMVLVVLTTMVLFVGFGGLILWGLAQNQPVVDSRVEQSSGKSDKDNEKGKADKDKRKPPAPEPLKPSLAKLLRDLKSDQPKMRLDAANALERLKPDEARPAMPALIAHIPSAKDRQVQRPLVRTLAKMARPGDTKAIELFANLVDDPDGETGGVAARAMARLAPERAAAVVKVLGKMLREGKDKERQQAVDTLSRLGDQVVAILPELGKALGDKKPKVRRKVAGLLGRLGAKAAPAVPDLAKALEKDDKVEVRLAAADALVNIPFPANEKAIPALVRIIQTDMDPSVRRKSVWALRSVPDLDKFGAVTALESLLGTEAPPFLPTRYSAAMVLARNKGPQASNQVVLALVHLLNNKSMKLSAFGWGDDRQDARFLAVKPLVKTINPMRREPIRTMLQRAAMDMEPKLRKEAEEALKGLK